MIHLYLLMILVLSAETLAGSRQYMDDKACTLPPDVGICVGNFRKYFYHHQSRDCKMFVWGGCSGNENRFSSKKECLLRCMMTNVDASSNEIRLASLDMDLMKEIMATVTDALSAEPLQQPKIPWTMRDIKMRAQ